MPSVGSSRKQAGPGDEHAGDGELLLLAAGQVPGPASEQRPEPGEEVQRLVQGFLAGPGGLHGHPQVAQHRQLGKHWWPCGT